VFRRDTCIRTVEVHDRVSCIIVKFSCRKYYDVHASTGNRRDIAESVMVPHSVNMGNGRQGAESVVVRKSANTGNIRYIAESVVDPHSVNTGN
jgi:hypothetical protein